MKLNLRKGEPDDLEVLLAMMCELYANDGVPFHAERSRQATRQLMQEPRAGAIWLLEIGEATIGYVVMTIGFSLEVGGWHGFIDELFVDAPHRGSGIGTAAVRHLESECARLGMTALLLEADLANEQATRLYHRLGFREHSRRLMTLPVGATSVQAAR
ncbi:MAG: GNAT family N-acetyltransferase [Bryobacteraceae bacterium]|nr:GNAT family N-acetyltransferase [Bryobacteraceae bacterium]